MAGDAILLSMAMLFKRFGGSSAEIPCLSIVSLNLLFVPVAEGYTI